MSTELVERDDDALRLSDLNRSYRDEPTINRLLNQASQHMHLVSPATSCGHLPEGFSVSFCTVFVNVDRETFKPLKRDEDDSGGWQRQPDSGEVRALSKSALDKIALAAGVSWDDRRSVRLDSGKDPRYARYKAVGVYRLFDDQPVTRFDEYELDLREGSANVEIIRVRAQSKGKTGDSELAEMRRHIHTRAITGARLRAIRSLGIRTYTRLELDEPFVIVRLMATGETEDPELRRMFAMERMKHSLQGISQMWGEGSTPALPPAPEAKDPPPVDATKPADEEDEPRAKTLKACEVCGTLGADVTEQNKHWLCTEPDCIKAYPREKGSPQPKPAGTPAPVASSGSTPLKGAAGAPVASGFKVPGQGPEGGLPIEEASDEVLTGWVRSIDRKLREGRTPPQYVEQDKKRLAAMIAELDRRESLDPIPY